MDDIAVLQSGKVAKVRAMRHSSRPGGESAMWQRRREDERAKRC